MSHTRRRLIPTTLLALLALLVGAPAAMACNGWQPQSLDDQLMCPTCHVPLNQSDSQAAQDIRNFVQQRCDAGWSQQRTKQSLIDQFGLAILAAPPFQGFDALAWLVPALLLAGGATTAAGLAWTWTRRTRTTQPTPHPAALPADLEARIDAELKQLD